MVCELQFGNRYGRGQLRKTLQIRGLPKALYQLSKAIETGGENHVCLSLSIRGFGLSGSVWSVCHQIGRKDRCVDRRVNALAGVTCTLAVSYTTLQRVTPTRLNSQILSWRHLHALVAQLKLDSENVFIWTQNERLHHVFHPSASKEWCGFVVQSLLWR